MQDKARFATGCRSMQHLQPVTGKEEWGNMKTILFQGDSITDAGRSKEDDHNVGNGYPGLVKGELMLEYPRQYTIYNRGVSANRIVDLYARMKEDIVNLNPDILSVLIGVNDVWHEYTSKNGITENKYYKIYSMLIEEVKDALPSVKIMIMEPFVLKASATEYHWEEFRYGVQKRAEKAKKVAEDFNLLFLPLQDKFDEAAKLVSADYWLKDGVHPTMAGHQLIKREWIKTFKAL